MYKKNFRLNASVFFFFNLFIFRAKNCKIISQHQKKNQKYAKLNFQQKMFVYNQSA